MAIYRGLGGINRQIKNIYRGLSGVNRQIKEQYRGYGGVNREVFSYLIYLYNAGDECVGLTGGYSKTYKTKGSSGTYSNSGGVITISNAAGSDRVECGCSTINKIDLTSYTKLKVNLIQNTGRFMVFLNQTYRTGDDVNSTTGLLAIDTDQTLATGTLEADITELTGTYYIILWELYTETTFTSRTAKFDKVWLE